MSKSPGKRAKRKPRLRQAPAHPRAGGRQPARANHHANRAVRSQSSSKKEECKITLEEYRIDIEAEERENAERLKAMGLKATPNGIVTIDEREARREAAHEELEDYELCFDLAGKFACQSAKKTGEAIGVIRDRYEAIALGFRCARGAQSTEAPLALGSALNAMAEEFERDRKGLLRFLDAVFKRWREIDQPNSLWRVQLMAQQHLGKARVVAQYLENIGAVSPCTIESQLESLRARIRQYQSRGRREALNRRKPRVT